MTGCWTVKKKKTLYPWSHSFNRLCTSGFIYHEEYFEGFENSGIWTFSRNTFGDKDFKVVSVVCGGSNEPSVLTPRPGGLITRIISRASRQFFGQEGDSRRSSSIPKDCTLSKQKWWTAERKIVTLTLGKERIQTPSAQRRPCGTPNHTVKQP